MSSDLQAITFETELGELILIASDKGVRRLSSMKDKKAVDEAKEYRVDRPSPNVRKWADNIRDYLAGVADTLDVPVDQIGTDFEKKVWAEMRRIPRGATVSYGELARRIGRPGAARAVGRACGDNTVAIVVPCHRVIAADGSLGGFGWGLGVKTMLLELEGALPIRR